MISFFKYPQNYDSFFVIENYNEKINRKSSKIQAFPVFSHIILPNQNLTFLHEAHSHSHYFIFKYFSKRPDQFISSCQTKMGRFRFCHLERRSKNWPSTDATRELKSSVRYHSPIFNHSGLSCGGICAFCWIPYGSGPIGQRASKAIKSASFYRHGFGVGP